MQLSSNSSTLISVRLLDLSVGLPEFQWKETSAGIIMELLCGVHTPLDIDLSNHLSFEILTVKSSAF